MTQPRTLHFHIENQTDAKIQIGEVGIAYCKGYGDTELKVDLPAQNLIGLLIYPNTWTEYVCVEDTTDGPTIWGQMRIYYHRPDAAEFVTQIDWKWRRDETVPDIAETEDHEGWKTIVRALESDDEANIWKIKICLELEDKPKETLKATR